MRTRSWSLALLPLVLFAAPAAPVGYTVRTVHVATVVGPDDGTHCDVAADLYLPTTASPQNPVPAILTTNGFGGAKDDATQTATGQAFAAHGYAVLSYSGLGFGGSGCKITLDDPDWDGKAARQLVDYLAGLRPATDGQRLEVIRLDGPGDPRVGMIGRSYGGQAQVAPAGPRHPVQRPSPPHTPD